MDRHPQRQLVVEPEKIVEPLWKKGPVDVVRPVNQDPAPDHEPEQREIDPMQPADPQRMLVAGAWSHRSKPPQGTFFVTCCERWAGVENSHEDDARNRRPGGGSRPFSARSCRRDLLLRRACRPGRSVLG